MPSLSSIKWLHKLIAQDVLNEIIIRCGMAPGLEFYFLRHGFSEAVCPLLAWKCSDDVCDCGFGDEVRVEAYVVCFVG